MFVPLLAIPEQLSNILDIIKNITFIDIVDIAFVSILLYYLYTFIRERRAGKLALGLVLLLVVQIISSIADMYLVQYIMKNVFQIGFITLVILFQPEIRSVLEKVGGQPFKGIKSIGGENKDQSALHIIIDEIVPAVCDLSRSKTGALIVFEKTTKLGDVISTGTIVDAYPASFLIKNVFFNKAPMHDGAMVMRNFRLYAAGCLLPLSNNPDIIKDLGTRHRAGIGVSENSDAVVIIVSEETGTISTAVEGKLVRGYDEDTLSEFLCTNLDIGGERERSRINLLLGRMKEKNKNEKNVK